MRVVSIPAGQTLDPNAESFFMKDSNLLHNGSLRPDLDQDWANVQEVHAGTSSLSRTDCSLWSATQPASSTSSDIVDAVVEKNLEEPLLHLSFLADDLSIDQAVPAPAKPLLRASSLKDRKIMTPAGAFIDKVLPAPAH